MLDIRQQMTVSLWLLQHTAESFQSVVSGEELQAETSRLPVLETADCRAAEELEFQGQNARQVGSLVEAITDCSPHSCV